MNDIIRLLPEKVANQIAAGEVVQRPSSVVKELVENALDAEATHIDILITDAGKTCIQVIDDGKGMSATDARTAFERHATSKIREADDLYHLTTMGFRGEALASIAAVAQVELRTRREEDELGTLLSISGSKVEGQEPVACPRGANFSVKNLFFNIPARRKFLKSNQTELNNIISEVDRIVLVRPDISFSLTHNGNELYQLPATTLRMRLMNVFGRKVSDQLLTLEVETTLVRISGYISRPESSRKKGAHQFFFINGRYMRHPYFHKAVMEAYEQLIPPGEQISYFIYMQADPAGIDVNIHPTKTEIKFEAEQAVWQILSAAVKESLGRFGAVPSIDFDTEGRPDIPSFEPEESVFAPTLPEVHFNPAFNPFDTESSERSYQRPRTDWETLYQGLKTEEVVPSAGTLFEEEEPVTDAPVAAPTADASSICFQFRGQYILTSVKSGLMIIDQHRAHVRVLFDRYLSLMSGHTSASQGVLFPEVLQLTSAQSLMLEHLQPTLSALGFELSSLGGGCYTVTSIPAGTEGINPTETVRNLVLSAMEHGGSPSIPAVEFHTPLALSLARAAAIPTGRTLSPAEMNELVTSLLACPSAGITPDGHRVFSILSPAELERMFR